MGQLTEMYLIRLVCSTVFGHVLKIVKVTSSFVTSLCESGYPFVCPSGTAELLRDGFS